MAKPIPPTLGRVVTYRQLSWLEMVERSWGSAYRQPDRGIYQFSDGRRFDSTDMYATGIYNGGIRQYPTFDSTEITMDSTGYTMDSTSET
jgi:hypothetical protein